MSEEIVRRILSNKKKMLFESTTVSGEDNETLDNDELILMSDETSSEEEVAPEETEVVEFNEEKVCACGSRNIVVEDGREICDDCGRFYDPVNELSEPLLPKDKIEEAEEYTKSEVLLSALKLWNAGRYEKAMLLCKKYGVPEKDFVKLLVRSYKESEEIEGDPIEEASHESTSKNFDMNAVKSGDTVKFPIKGMTEVPVLGKRFKVGWLSGKCTEVNSSTATMLVEDASVLPNEDKLGSSIIRALQKPVSTSARPQIDAASAE